jgi:hypothetical protein
MTRRQSQGLSWLVPSLWVSRLSQLGASWRSQTVPRGLCLLGSLRALRRSPLSRLSLIALRRLLILLVNELQSTGGSPGTSQQHHNLLRLLPVSLYWILYCLGILILWGLGKMLKLIVRRKKVHKATD